MLSGCFIWISTRPQGLGKTSETFRSIHCGLIEINHLVAKKSSCERMQVRVAVGCALSPEGVHAMYSYLVDPASSHMLVSKIKPCMSKYKPIYTVKLRMAH